MSEFSERVALDDGIERKKVQISQPETQTAAMEEDHDDDDEEDDSIMIDPSSLPTPVTRTPISQLENTASSSASDPNSLSFQPVSHHSNAGLTQRRKVGVPPHRMTPLKRDWIKIYTPLVEECGLQVRMNAGKRLIEMKVRCHSSVSAAIEFELELELDVEKASLDERVGLSSLSVVEVCSRVDDTVVDVS